MSRFSNIAERSRDFGEFLLSPRGVASVLGKTAIVIAAFFALKSGETLEEMERFSVPELKLSSESDIGTRKGREPLEAYKIIKARNLFGTSVPVAVATPAPSATRKSKLRLVGTNADQGKSSFAIIEDQNKNEQDVYSLNDKVFGEGVLVEIQRESVKVQFADTTETLLLDDGKPATPARSGMTAEESTEEDNDQTDYTVAEAELSDALANLPLLLSQARAVPYFRNGQSIGMRLFAIRSGSLYEKLGMKNGDIITAVNENSLSDPTQALRLFEQLKNERSIKVKMERNNVSREVNYTIR